MTSREIILTTTPQRASKVREFFNDLQTTAPNPARNGRIPAPHGASFFAVKCIKDGGAAGGVGSDCSWTFELRDIHTDAVLATEVAPLWPWIPDVEYEVPSVSGVVGAAFVFTDGSVVLWAAAVAPVTEACE